MGKYSGADWVQETMKFRRKHPDMVLSPLGRAVADLLGELFFGIYHLPARRLDVVDWSNTHSIEITLDFSGWSTYDGAYLTRLVFLAHHLALRVDLSAATVGYMKLRFWQRNRSGDGMARHPYLDEGVNHFKRTVSLPEWDEEGAHG